VIHTVPLRRLARCLDGKRVPLSGEERADMAGNVPYWGAGGVLDHIDRAIFDEPLVLLGEDGAPFFEPGRDVAFLLDGPAWINNHIHVLRPNSDTDRRFLVYVLNVADYSAYISGSTRDKLTQEDMWNIRVPDVPHDQQRAIADYLDRETARIDALIASRDRLGNLLRERREANVAQLFDSALDQAGVVPLWTIMQPVDRRDRPDLDVLSVYRDHGVVPKASRTDNFNKTPEDVSRYLVVEPGDVVVNKMKAWQGSIAVSPFYGIVSPDYLVCRADRKVDSKFLHYALRSSRMRAEYAVRSEGVRPSQWRLQWEQMRTLTLPIPSPARQAVLTASCEAAAASIEVLADAASRQVAVLRERRQALITAAVTGQVEIPVAA
jgi:type I restriction enzyme S subunit